MAIKHVLLIVGVGCVVGIGAVGASTVWNSKAEREAKRWQLEEKASLLTRENARLVQQIAAQLRTVALLRTECSVRSATAGELKNRLEDANVELAPAISPDWVELHQTGNRVEVAPGGPMAPITD